VFCLICSSVSPAAPPSAAWRFVTAKELKVVLAIVEFKLEFKNLVLEVSILVKTQAAMLDSTPPPVKYLIVKVVSEGAMP